MPAKTCRVSFKHVDRIRHQAVVQADSLYGAAALGLKALRKSDWIDVIGPATRIDIQVLQPPVEHFMMYVQFLRWLDGGAKNPAEAVRKKKLKELLASWQPDQSQ
jgi:hypothetical protein